MSKGRWGKRGPENADSHKGRKRSKNFDIGGRRLPKAMARREKAQLSRNEKRGKAVKLLDACFLARAVGQVAGKASEGRIDAIYRYNKEGGTRGYGSGGRRRTLQEGKMKGVPSSKEPPGSGLARSASGRGKWYPGRGKPRRKSAPTAPRKTSRSGNLHRTLL